MAHSTQPSGFTPELNAAINTPVESTPEELRLRQREMAMFVGVAAPTGTGFTPQIPGPGPQRNRRDSEAGSEIPGTPFRRVRPPSEQSSAGSARALRMRAEALRLRAGALELEAQAVELESDHGSVLSTHSSPISIQQRQRG